MESVRDYELKAFFTYVIKVLERLGIPYMVVGGFAGPSTARGWAVLLVKVKANVSDKAPWSQVLSLRCHPGGHRRTPEYK